MKMRAAVFEGAGQPLAIRQVDVPTPGAGQLLLRVHRCGICGSDLHLTDRHAAWQVPAGTVLGHEYAGEIVDLGEGTGDAWREGDRVAALPLLGCGHCRHCLDGEAFHCATALRPGLGDLVGGYCEYALVGAREAVRMRADVSWEEGAFTEPLAVGLHAIAKADMKPGTSVLVLGAGPIGLSAAACARAFGAGTVVVSARTDRHADRARAMGATEFMIADERLGESFARVAGGPPELIVECTGAAGVLTRCAELAAIKGKVVVAGGCNGVDSLNVIPPTVKELTYQFIVCYSNREFALAQELIASRRIDPMPMYSGSVTLAELPASFEALRADKAACKLMIDPTARD